MIETKHLFIFTSILVLLCSCLAPWEVMLIGPDGQAHSISRQTMKGLSAFAESGSVPLERILLTGGYDVIQDLYITDETGDVQTFDWAASAEKATLLENGRLVIQDRSINAARIQGTTPPMLETVTAHIIDIAPTAARALGIDMPEQATGSPLAVQRAQHVLLVFLDGFGYVRYQEAREDHLIPYLSNLDAPHIALTTYPPATAVATASLLTGASPHVHGVQARGIRSTEVQTLFDVAAEAGLTVTAVEGNALSFNLRNADITLSGDRDGNGSTDDNVLDNALAVLEKGMPDLLWVHFHGIDDVGHTYGPDAPEERQTIANVDAAVKEIVTTLPERTLVIIFADHGMHSVQEQERQGNHGHLIARDMFIPIWMLTVGN